MLNFPEFIGKLTKGNLSSVDLLNCDIMGQNQSHFPIFSYGVKQSIFREHPVLHIVENWKSVSCLYPKILNFEIGEIVNLKIL